MPQLKSESVEEEAAECFAAGKLRVTSREIWDSLEEQILGSASSVKFLDIEIQIPGRNLDFTFRVWRKAREIFYFAIPCYGINSYYL